MKTHVEAFFDKETFTLTYVVSDIETKDSILIDPVLDYDVVTSKTSAVSVQNVISYIKENNLKLHHVIETHAHADHLSGAQKVKEIFPGVKIAIGNNIKKVQSVFKSIFNLKELNTEGNQFDLLLKSDEVMMAGSLKVKVIDTPGHTPACISLLINDKKLFTGDALFMPDYGTGRCDFPAGSSASLYDSVFNKLYELDDDTEVYVGHDYKPNGRELRFKTTIKESRESNIHIRNETNKDKFIKMRDARDSTLNSPRLLLPSIQININAGKLPEKEDNEVSYIKLPIS